MQCIKSLCLSVATTLVLAVLLVSAARAAQPEDVKVVVLPFEINAGDDLGYLEESLPELIADRLREAGFTVVDRDVAMGAVEQKGMDIVDVESAREVALLTDSEFAVFGSFSQLGETLSLDARLVEGMGTTPAQTIFVTKEGLINLLPAVDELVDQMRSSLLKRDAIAEIDVEGTKVLDKEVVLMRLSIREGDEYDPKKINSELRTIYGLGYFDDVTVKTADVPGGKKVIFDVKEKPRIQAIGVKGADAIDADDIIEAASTKKGSVLNLKVLGDDISTIREMYRKEGYYKAKVSHEIEGDESGARLNFVIDEGPELYITEIRIEGAEDVDPDDIRDELMLKEKDFLHWFNKSGVFNEPFLERDAAAVMAFYANRGYMDAKVGRPEVDITDDGIHITFTVVEGPRYTVGEVSFEGDLIADPATLQGVVGIDGEDGDEGVYVDRSRIQEDMKALSDFYNNYGYAYAETDVRLQEPEDAGPDEHVMNVVFVLAKHQKVHIRRVLVEGNVDTRDNVILREMRLADGDLYSGQKLARSVERLDKLGFFSDVDVEPVPTGDPSEMDLRVKVKDKPTGRIGGGAGYSSLDGPFLAADVTEQNLFGKGYALGFNGKISERTTAFNANFMNPSLYDTKLGMGFNAHHNLTDEYTYDIQSTAGSVNFSYPLGEYTNLFWDYTLDYYTIQNVDSNAAQSVRDEKGGHLNSSGSFTIFRDTVNDNFLPTSGTTNGFSMRMGGGIFGGDDSYIKYAYDSQWYTAIWNDLVFHWRGHLDYIGNNWDRDHIPLFVRISYGGIDNIRGYSTGKIAPRDKTTGDVIGGNKGLFTNLELLFPLSREYGVIGVAFFDAGNTWDEGEMFFDSAARQGVEGPTLGLYKSVGAGLRWNSPMGSIRIEYGYGLDEIYDSKRHNIEFTMGQTF